MENKYFKKFNKIDNQIDFYKKFDISENTGTRDIQINTSDRIENISAVYYGDQKYFWITPFINKFEDMFVALPLTIEEINKLARSRVLNGSKKTYEEEYAQLMEENIKKKNLKVIPYENLIDFLYKFNKVK